MRIAYFADNFYPEITGISDSVITTGEELRKRGHEVVYVAPWYPKKEYKKNHRPDILVKRLPSLPFPNSPTGQSRIVVPLGFALPFMRRFKPDIIHAQSPHGAGLEALLASRVLGVPLIGTEHTPVEEFFHYSPAVAHTFGAMWLWWEQWYYNRCRFVTAPYQGLIDEMRKRGLHVEGRGQANPVPFASTPSTAEEKTAAKVELKLDGPALLCSGRLAPEKKVGDILKALALLVKDFPTLTLIITGHGSAEPSLKKLVQELKIEKNVRFVGFVDSSQLPLLYRAADVYVIMSTAETQSLSLMQAFAAGLPAVSAKARGLVDYTPPEAGFLVEPGAIAGLAARLTELLKNDSLRERMGLAGAQFVTTLSPAHIADEWEKIYSSLCPARNFVRTEDVTK
ncbi:MAG: glycosyltransferase [bacterium]|nr:glycosyltransferase [bacterium]